MILTIYLLLAAHSAGVPIVRVLETGAIEQI